MLSPESCTKELESIHLLRQHGQITLLACSEGLSSGLWVAPSHGQHSAEPSCNAFGLRWLCAGGSGETRVGHQGWSWVPSSPGGLTPRRGSRCSEAAKDISVGAQSGGAVDAHPSLAAKRARLFASIFPAGCSPVGCPTAALPPRGEALGSLSPLSSRTGLPGEFGQAKRSSLLSWSLLEHDGSQGADLNPRTAAE